MTSLKMTSYISQSVRNLEIEVDGNGVSLSNKFMTLKQLEPEIFHFFVITLREHGFHFKVLDFFDFKFATQFFKCSPHPIDWVGGRQTIQEVNRLPATGEYSLGDIQKL